MGGGPETILITGGRGFIGRNIIDHFLDKPYRLVVVDPGSAEDSAENEDIVVYRTDMSEPAVLKDIIIGEDPQYVVHLAGLVTASRDSHDLKAMLKANSLPLVNILDALAAANRLRLFINFGSAEEYGPIPVPFREDMPVRPQSPYALAKLQNTYITTYSADQEGIPAITLRPGMVYGPYQPMEKFLPSVIRASLDEETIVMTEGSQTRDVVFAPDLARIVECFLRHPFDIYGGIFNAAMGKEIPLIDLVRLIIEITGSRSEIATSLPYRKKEAMRFVCDVGKTSKIIGKDFSWTTLQEGLNKTINHYREFEGAKQKKGS